LARAENPASSIGSRHWRGSTAWTWRRATSVDANCDQYRVAGDNTSRAPPRSVLRGKQDGTSYPDCRATTRSRRSASRARAGRRPRTAVLLKARAAQADQAVLLESALPGPVLLLGQLLALQRLFEDDTAGAQRTCSTGSPAEHPFGHSGRFRGLKMPILVRTRPKAYPFSVPLPAVGPTVGLRIPLLLRIGPVNLPSIKRGGSRDLPASDRLKDEVTQWLGGKTVGAEFTAALTHLVH
jgi:hypothetical protein